MIELRSVPDALFETVETFSSAQDAEDSACESLR